MRRPNHGPDGIGGCYEASPQDAPVVAAGPRVLVERLREAAASGPTALLALGPLTNVALALDEGLAGEVGRVVVMGGAFGNPGGNITDIAEYNWYFDAVAAHHVVGCGMPLEVVPLDVTKRVVIGPGDLDALHGGDGPAGLARRMLEAGIGYAEARGEEGMVVHDALAAAILVDPSIAGFHPLSLSVETAVARRGHAVASGRGPVHVALDVDVARAKGLILALLAGDAARAT
jgi:inosine-uridine nucleoside N-ribohydrolase